MSQECDAKIVVLGSAGVGKTSLALRFVQGTYRSEQTSTIGASFLTKRMIVEGWKIKLQIWDTAGQERFRSMAPMYYRSAAAAILVYDITSAESFETMKGWFNELNDKYQGNIIIAIAGNKLDLEHERRVNVEDAKSYAQSIDAFWTETSAKDNTGIEEMFSSICQQLIQKKKQSGSLTTDESRSSLPLSQNNNQPPPGGCC
eukprot:TRINITY_DN199_c0_g1_i5.p1 TRINITY_DN199_c0_g1~~TRINITY_DN199_c0_g1_i5.p1  ORF type:complete len:202 (+),score=37.91 TRINITY_DN199_c0_g1_i5:98-703(+)